MDIDTQARIGTNKQLSANASRKKKKRVSEVARWKKRQSKKSGVRTIEGWGFGCEERRKKERVPPSWMGGKKEDMLKMQRLC
jgi:hypothetical protein